MTTVNAIRFNEIGAPDVLHLDSITLDKPTGHQVLVENKAIGVNFIDTYHRSGLYPCPLPSGLGSEAAGTVVETGEQVTGFKPGDRVVYASAPLGAYAEAHLVPESALIRLPETMTDTLAAGVLLKGLTAAYLLLKTYPVSAGDKVLIHAAAGGVGSLLSQWAKALGAYVIGTVGREEKVALARHNGCDEVILYRQTNVVEAVQTLTSGQGVDVVYDSVGHDTFSMSIDSLRPRGMLVSFGNASGAVPEFKPLLLAQKGSLYITRPKLADYVAHPSEQQFLADALFACIAEGKLNVNVNHTFSLAEAQLAHETLERGVTTGSMVLIP